MASLMAGAFGRPSSGRFYWPMLPLCAGVFMAAADQTVVVTVLPDMLADLHVPIADLDRASWTITGYLIGYVAAMPLMGRLADRYGWPAMFVLAMAVFAGGSALVALSPRLPGLLGLGGPELGWAVGARVFQAIGGGAAIPIALAAAAGTGSVGRQAVMFGIVGASAEAGGVVGPLWGGLVGHIWSWEWAFWLNLPLVALLVLALRPLTTSGKSTGVLTRKGSLARSGDPGDAAGPGDPGELGLASAAPGKTRKAGGSVDYAGGALIALTLTLIIWALVDTAALGMRTAALVVSASMTGAAAWVWVRRSADPIVPRGLFSIGSFRWATSTHLLVGAALIIAMVTVPLMANTVLGTSALEGGLRLLRMTLAIAAGAVAGGMIAGKIGARVPAVAGLVLVAVGMLGMSRWDIAVADPWMTVHLAVTGLGFGLLIAPVVASALRDVHTHARATASSWVTLSRMLGMAIGLAAMTAWGAARFEGLVADLPVFGVDQAAQALLAEGAAEAGVAVFRGFFLAGAVCAVAAIVPSWLMTRAGKAGDEANGREATGDRVTRGEARG